MRALALSLMVAAGPLPAFAQDARAARDAAFARMYDAPTDRAAMVDYARASIALRDYEAAVAVLERLVALEPGNAEARKQLALAYFALGADVMAARQIDLIAQTDPDLATEMAGYRNAAEERMDPQGVTGTVWVGSLNATSPERSFAEAGVTLVHRMEMGGAQGAEWVTRLALSAALPSDSALDKGHRFDLRSGPVLRIGGTATGPRLQPYALVSDLRDAEGTAETRYGLGMVAVVPVGAVSVAGDVAFGQVQEGDDRQGGFRRADAGLTLNLPGDGLLRLRGGFDSQEGGTLEAERRQTAGVDLGRSFRPVLWGEEQVIDAMLSVTDERQKTEDTRRDRRIVAATLRGPLGGPAWFEIGFGRARTAGTAGTADWAQLRMGWDF